MAQAAGQAEPRLWLRPGRSGSEGSGPAGLVHWAGPTHLLASLPGVWVAEQGF